MDLYDVYDKNGQDGKDNQEAFEKLPSVAKYFISSEQKLLVDKVVNNVKKLYGEEGVKSLVKTSGFRSRITNNRVGGVPDSLHLLGLACDFRKCGIFEKLSIPTCCNIECQDHKNHWHIQFKRK